MRFLVAEDEAAIRVLAQQLSGEIVTALDALPRAGNNRMYSVRTASSRFALKLYAPGAAGQERLKREYGALEFLHRNGAAGMIPAAIAADREAGCALYQWIEGGALLEHDVCDVDAALAFIARLHCVRVLPAAQRLPTATEALSCGSVFVAQLAERLTRLLRAVQADNAARTFLSDELQPGIETLIALCRRQCRAAGIDFEQPLPASLRTLSPSDFSFHNALRRPDGALVFLDLEYFGWDDPVKLVADFLWHPAMQLSTCEAEHFARGAQAIFAADDRSYTGRLRAYFALFGMKWCLIILNEFLADDWERRQFSGERRSWDVVKAAQLSKARQLFAQVVGQGRQALLC